MNRPTEIANGDTRDGLIRAAKRLFAEKGFYGASIASIATELGLTKQALIHHFGTKERLYGEVLAQMADRLSVGVDRVRAVDADPVHQLEELLVNVHRNSVEHPDDSQLLMRELLDNKARAEHAHSWYMKDFLDMLVGIARKVPGTKLTKDEALARIYLVLGAINYFAISQPTLTQMYGKRGYTTLKAQSTKEVRRLVREAFGGR
jgi:AcrR family transcriptional regulator